MVISVPHALITFGASTSSIIIRASSPEAPLYAAGLERNRCYFMPDLKRVLISLIFIVMPLKKNHLIISLNL